MTEAASPDTSAISQRRLGHVLVTGSRGFIGGALARTLAQTGESVVGSDLGHQPTDGTDFRACDLTDKHQVDALLGRDRFDTIFHCGAVSGPMVLADRPLEIWRVNALGTAHLLEALRRQGFGRFILCSSCSVYGRVNRAVVDEDTPPDPASIYGVSKVAAEQAMLGYVREFGIEAVALRLAWVYGPGRQTPTTLEDLLRSSLDGRPLRIAGASEEMTHYIHLDDAVAGLMASAHARLLPRLIYNISAGDGLPMAEVVAIVRALAPETKVTFTGGFSSSPLLAKFSLVNARQDLGFHPRIALAEGLRLYREALHRELPKGFKTEVPS